MIMSDIGGVSIHHEARYIACMGDFNCNNGGE